MKNVRITKNNIIISDLNLYMDPTVFLNINTSLKTWGIPERWVRIKFNTVDINGNPITIYPDEVYTNNDVLAAEIRPIPLQNTTQEWVKLKADYTVEILDYKRVPKSITIRQAKQALHASSLLDTIESYMITAPIDVRIDWNESSYIERDWHSLSGIATTLGLTSIQVDDLFILAETL